MVGTFVCSHCEEESERETEFFASRVYRFVVLGIRDIRMEEVSSWSRREEEVGFHLREDKGNRDQVALLDGLGDNGSMVEILDNKEDLLLGHHWHNQGVDCHGVDSDLHNSGVVVEARDKRVDVHVRMVWSNNLLFHLKVEDLQHMKHKEGDWSMNRVVANVLDGVNGDDDVGDEELVFARKLVLCQH